MTEVRRQKLLKRLKQKVKNNEIDLEFYLDRSENHFLTYCNRSDVPKNADFLIYDLVISLLKAEGIIKKEDGIKQVHRGDTTITYKDTKGEVSVFDEFKNRLNKFRKLNLVTKG